MDYRILGPLEVCQDGGAVPLEGDRQRALLAILLLQANAVVSADELVDGVWGERPPQSAANALRVHVSRLRKVLANGAERRPVPSDGVLVTRGHGYSLRVEPGELDADRFRDLLEQGRNALANHDPGTASKLLRSALAMWRGPPLADFRYEPFAQAAIAQLDELRVAALEERIEADMALGRHTELVAELAALVEHNPLRERLRAQLMLALYRCGRQAEALDVYQEFRRTLSEQLGLDPGPALQQRELAILGRDPSLDLPSADPEASTDPAGSPITPAPTVTVHRRRARLAVGGMTLLVLALAAAVVASSGGGTAPPTVIAADSVGAINTSSGAVEASAPLGTSPSAMAAGDGAVWVTNYDAGTVSRIDPATQGVVETIPVGSTPSGIAVGAGALWVADNWGETVARIDPAVDRVVQTIAVGNAPSGIAVGNGSVWVTNTSDRTLSRIDAITGAVVKTIALGAGATGVAAGWGAVWVSDAAGGRVLRVDPQTGHVTQVINVGGGADAITVGAGSVWVANSLDGTVSRIDPRTNAVTATIAVGDGPAAIAVGSGAVWVTNQYAGTVSRIDPASDTVTRTIAVGNRPQGLAISNGLVWFGVQSAATSHRGGTLSVLTHTSLGTADPATTLFWVPLLELTNDGLTAYKRVGGSDSVEVVPDLAVALPTPTDGGTTYTFQLRRGIRYSSGAPVRPEDFRRALERDIKLGPSLITGDFFANVIGGAACAAHPTRCDLSRGVVTDDVADTVTFHLVAPSPEFLARLTLADAVAVPAGTPNHDIGNHPIPATGPYEVASVTPREVRLARNPYFHVWSLAARPDAYPDHIIFRIGATPAAELTAVEHNTADITFDGPPPDRLSELQTRFASRLHIAPGDWADALMLNTRVAPFTDLRVRQALNYAVDRGEVARLIGDAAQPTCQALPPYFPGYKRYCPYTLDPNAAGVWRAPDLAKAQQLIAASHTRGTPVTIWNLAGGQGDLTAAARDLVSLLNGLGYPTRLKDVSADPSAGGRFADSRTRAQAAALFLYTPYLSASQVIDIDFGCQHFHSDSTGNNNFAEFCDPQLDAQIRAALNAEGNNSPTATNLWAQADRTVTIQAPMVPLAIPSGVVFVSSRVSNVQDSFQEGVLLDQLRVR